MHSIDSNPTDREAAAAQLEIDMGWNSFNFVQYENNNPTTTVQYHNAQLAYEGILRGFAVMAKQYAKDNKLPAEEQQRLLDRFLGRVVYKRPAGQPGE